MTRLVKSLKPSQTIRLKELENAIVEHTKSGKTFIVAAALRCISDEKLFIQYNTIYQYAQQKFGFSRRTCNTYLCASFVYESIIQDPSLPLPMSISHIRSLYKYTPEQRRNIWKLVTEKGSVTEDAVIRATAQYDSGFQYRNVQNEFYTPKVLIEAGLLLTPRGIFDLDPCSTTHANEIHGVPIAETIYTEMDDGYIQKWNGNVWLSPPVTSSPAIIPLQWFNLAERKYFSGEIVSCLLLLKVENDPTWFQKVGKYPHCFLNEKVVFQTPSKKEKSFDGTHVVVYLGSNVQLFCESFGTLGSIAGYNSWSFKPSNQEPTFTNYEDPWQVQMEDFDYQTNLYNKAA